LRGKTCEKRIRDQRSDNSDQEALFLTIRYLLAVMPLYIVCCFGCAAELGENFLLARSGSSSPSILISLPLLLPNSTRRNVNVERGHTLGPSRRLAAPTAITSPSCGLFLRGSSGMMMPPYDGFLSLQCPLTITRFVQPVVQIDCPL